MKDLFYDAKIYLGLSFISLLLLLLDSLNLLYFPKSLLQQFTIPVQYGFYHSGQTIFRQFNFLTASRFAAKENQALKKQLAEMLIENAKLRKNLAEKQILIDQTLGLNPQTFDLLGARIIGTGRYLLIDKGLNDGVKTGQAVVYKESYVGQIKRVDPKTSQVLLTFDPDSKIAVFTQNKTGRARGMLIGQFGSQAFLEKILHQEPLETGDLVYTEGSEGTLPRGLILGKVSKVLENQNEVFKQAEVTPIFETENLDVVFVVKNT